MSRAQRIASMIVILGGGADLMAAQPPQAISAEQSCYACVPPPVMCINPIQEWGEVCQAACGASSQPEGCPDVAGEPCNPYATLWCS
jgi:hypothetical protein